MLALANEHDARPHLHFGGGVVMRHVRGDTYERITLDGRHLQYLVAENIEYAPTLQQQFLNTRK